LGTHERNSRAGYRGGTRLAKLPPSNKKQKGPLGKIKDKKEKKVEWPTKKNLRLGESPIRVERTLLLG